MDIYTSCCNEGIDLIACDCHLTVLQFEDQKVQTASEINALMQASVGLVATRPGASCWMKRGPHREAAITSLEATEYLHGSSEKRLSLLTQLLVYCLLVAPPTTGSFLSACSIPPVSMHRLHVCRPQYYYYYDCTVGLCSQGL